MSEDLHPPKQTELPRIKPIRLGEYGKTLEDIWEEFTKIRQDGFYAADENQQEPRFSTTIVLHGVRQKNRVVFGTPIQSGDFSFTPRSISLVDTLPVIKNICSIGVISSDIEFEETSRDESLEEETFGTTDFWIQNQQFSSLQDFLEGLREKFRLGIGKEFITDLGDTRHSSTIMFAFDTSRKGLAALMQYSMRDNQPEETLWAKKFGNYINFPMKGSGLQLSIPVGLPANYIEYIVINEKSSYWEEDWLNQLRSVAICDNHPIPLVSAHTGAIVK